MTLSKHLKVLLISPLPPPVGGIASWTVNIKEYYKSQNIKELELIHCDSSNRSRRITSRSLFARLYYGIINSFQTYKQVKGLIKNKPQVIHLVSSASFALLKDLLIIQHAKRKNIPTITHWRFGRIPQLVEQNNWEYKLLKRVLSKSSLAIVIDQTSYKTLLKVGFKNIINMPNPIASDIGDQSRLLINGYKNRPFADVLFVGHVVVEKGVFELVQAATRIKNLNKLTLIGPYEKDTKEALVNIAKERNDGLWLHFLGALDKQEVMKKMRSHSILTLPSYTEGFPNVVLEGMANACSIIGTNVGAIPEMLDIDSQNHCGICVPAKNATKLEEAIDFAINNPIKMEEMAKNGLHKVLSSYTMERVFDDYHSHWKNLSKLKK